jgi:hypothetical protein
MRYRRKMTAMEAREQLEGLEPVPVPPDGPTYEHIVGNQIRWAVKVLRYERYRWRVRKLERLKKRQGGSSAANRTSEA